MDLNPTTLLVVVCLFLAAFIKGTTGLGFPLIATPMVALLLDIRSAVTVLIIPSLLMDIAQILRGNFSHSVFTRFLWLLLFGVIGAFLGTKLLVTLPLWILNLSLGVMVLVFVGTNSFQFDFRIPSSAEKFASPAVGLISGFLNGMTNVSGPALAIYLFSLRLPKTEFVKAISSIFFVIKIGQLVGISTWNLLSLPLLRLSVGLMVFIFLGFFAGIKTHDRINQQTFNRALLALLFVVGMTLVVLSLSL